MVEITDVLRKALEVADGKRNGTAEGTIQAYDVLEASIHAVIRMIETHPTQVNYKLGDIVEGAQIRERVIVWAGDKKCGYRYINEPEDIKPITCMKSTVVSWANRNGGKE